MKVRLNEPTFGEVEITAAVEVMRSTYVTQGNKVREFEQAFCEKFGFKHAVACNSGSSANLLIIAALYALGRLKQDDEIIVPALSWSTTISPLIQHGLIPVFVDCDETFNITTGGPLVMPVHVYGNPCKIDGELIIEDCCEAMGAPVGKTGIATFSFYFSHHITTFEGGMIGVNDDDLADMLRIQRSHGWIRDVKSEKYTKDSPNIDPSFLFVETGYNLRLTEPQAAIGLIQLTKLDDIVKQRRLNHKAYVKALNYDFFRFQKISPESSCFSFAIILENAPFTVHEIQTHLRKAGIETRPIIAGNMALQPVMKKHKHHIIGNLKNATNIMKNGFAIGNHQAIGEDQVNYIAEQIEAFVCEH